MELLSSINDFTHENISQDENGIPKIIAKALVIRTISNLKSVIILLENQRIVEARTIIRCCFENAFWAQAILVDGTAFSDKMANAEMHHRRSRGTSILEGPKVLSHNHTMVLRMWLKTSEKRFGKSKPLVPKDVAYKYGSRTSYIFYNLLSSDSSHPSVHSLNRYILNERDSSKFKFFIDPPIDDDEIAESLEYLCLASMGVCENTNIVLGSPIDQGALQDLAAKYTEISEASAALRATLST